MADGAVADGFEPVRDAVDAALAMQDGAGAITVAAYVHGELVVDLWAGTARSDSLLHTWSAIKPVTGTCLLLLVDRGAIELDTPVREVWPELRAAADGRLLVRHVLTHQAGLESIPGGDARGLLDWERAISGLEAADPDWPPGEGIGEHALTYGHLVGELVRRVDGRPFAEFLRAELTEPLALDVHVGVLDADLGRVVATSGLSESWWAANVGRPGAIREVAVDPSLRDADINSDAWRRGVVPAVNGHASARGLACFYRVLLDGGLPAMATAPGASGVDVVLSAEVTWNFAGGRTEDGDVGMGGLGGQWAGARPSEGLAWAFLTSVMGGFDRVDHIEEVLLQRLQAR